MPEPVEVPTPRALRLKHLGSKAYQSLNSQHRRCLVFTVEKVTGSSYQYEGLLIEFADPCEVEETDGTRRMTPAVLIHCREKDYEDRFGAIINDVKQTCESGAKYETEADATRLVQDYAGLFRPIPPLTEKEQRGLWGELELLSRSTNLDEAIRAWRGPEDGLIDFLGNGVEIEVKTALGRHRHHVRHAQVSKPETNLSRRLLWSLNIQESPSGRSLEDLVKGIRQRLAHRRAFEEKLHKAGYIDDPAYDETKYKVQSERTVEHSSVPEIPAMPVEVTNLEYDLEFEGLPSLTKADAKAAWEKMTTATAHSEPPPIAA